MLFVAWAAPLGWLAMNLNIPIAPASWGGIFPGHLLALFLALGSCYEYVRLMRAIFPQNGFWLAYLWLGAMLLLSLFDRSLPGIFPIYALLLVVALEAFVFGKRTKNRWSRASLFFSGNVFLYIAGLAMLKLFEEPFSTIFMSFAHPLIARPGVCLVVGAVIMCDTGAYLVGKAIGRHHYSSVSPNKTIEGAIGGFVFALVWSAVGWHFLTQSAFNHVAWGILMGIFVGLFAQIGDLIVSIIKRYFKVKDASDIIPGHGGILDRFGSVFFTLPVLWLYFWLLSKFIPH